MHCSRWYAQTGVDQCNLPGALVAGIDSSILGYKRKLSKENYGKPSELNRNNNCEFYDELSFFGKFFRRIDWKVPMKPTIEKKV